MIFTMFIAWFSLGVVTGRWFNRRTILKEMETHLKSDDNESSQNLTKYLTLQKLFHKI